MKTVTSDTANQAFKATLRKALDSYHPQWEFGYKGKGRGNRRSTFTTVARETLNDWVTGEKGHCPQQQIFEDFLGEAEFPDEIVEHLWEVYRTFKRERRRSTASRTAHNRGSYDTLLSNAVTLGKEYMNERYEQSEKGWLTSSNREMVGTAVERLGEQAIHEAVRSLAQNFSPEECADIVLTAFKKIVDASDTRENIIAWVQAVRKT